MTLEGRVALVTGAGMGIGAATARALAAQGAAVLVAHFGPQEVVEEIRRAGGEALAVEADLGGPGRPGRTRRGGPGGARARSRPRLQPSGPWVQDTFSARHREGPLRPPAVRAEVRRPSTSLFAVDARGDGRS